MEEEWEIYATNEVLELVDGLDAKTRELVATAVDILADLGPALGRPMADRIKGSVLQNLKELRPGSTGRSEIRILFAFDPWRCAILLIAGDKSGDWEKWYDRAIPEVEQRFARYLEERKEERARQ